MNNEREESELELRRGPWTLEEDTLLTHYIAHHGEGRWNLLAKCSGLNRTGKSCRLRWLNYLKPDIKRGNLTPQEQLLILELHSNWGNRWSKIAQHLPGRTDNEIKNYWRTRVQKQARQLNIESDSKRFLDAVRSFWIPRLLEKMDQNSSSSSEPVTTQNSFLVPQSDSSANTNSNSDSNSNSIFNSSPDQNKTAEIPNELSMTMMNICSSTTSALTSDFMNFQTEVEITQHHPISPFFYNDPIMNENYVDCYNMDCAMSEMEDGDDMAYTNLWNMDDTWHPRE